MEYPKILIVEDEILIAEDLKDTLWELGFKNVEMVHDKASALSRIETYCPDITLLDIRLEQETDGLQIGAELQKRKTGLFIYITAHSDVAMVKEIVKTNPAGYITKPIRKSDLYASISLAAIQLKNQETKRHTIQIKDGYSNILVDVSNIRYIEAEGNYLNIFCDEKKYVLRQSMDSFVDEVNSPLLYKIHRSYTVNVAKISRYSKKEAVVGDVTLPVSRNEKDDFETYMKKLDI
jgi:two-component system, LytTR family, response regulator LytT